MVGCRQHRRLHGVAEVGNRLCFGWAFGVTREHDREVLVLDHQDQTLRVVGGSGVRGQHKRGGSPAGELITDWLGVVVEKCREGQQATGTGRRSFGS